MDFEYSGNTTKVTNRVKVHRQATHKTAGLIFCAPTVAQLPGSGFNSWHQFVEWMEYLRFIQVSQVFMPEPLQNAPYPLDEEFMKAVRYYKTKTFLETFPAAYHKFYLPDDSGKFDKFTDEKKFYWILSNNKPEIYTFCYLKYGPKFSHVMVADFDEIPAFNISRYPTVMSALNDTIRFHQKNYNKTLPSFVMRDYELMECNDTLTPKVSVIASVNSSIIGSSGKQLVSLADVLGNDTRILGRGFQARKYSCGKSIYSSNNTLMMWHHQNWLPVSDLDFFNEKQTEDPAEQVIHVKMNRKATDTKQNFLENEMMFLSHARSRLVHSVTQLK